jgi:hypothetical protein
VASEKRGVGGLGHAIIATSRQVREGQTRCGLMGKKVRKKERKKEKVQRKKIQKEEIK